MVYFGISTVKSLVPTRAWQLSRDCGSRPQALSSKSSSFSSAAARLLKPSRTITWQVVQAQAFSQACSILIPLFNNASQILVPVGTSRIVPSGQISWCGKILICGMALFELIEAVPGHGLANTAVHAARGEIGAGAIELGDSLFNFEMVVAGADFAQILHSHIQLIALGVG